MKATKPSAIARLAIVMLFGFSLSWRFVNKLMPTRVLPITATEAATSCTPPTAFQYDADCVIEAKMRSDKVPLADSVIVEMTSIYIYFGLVICPRCNQF